MTNGPSEIPHGMKRIYQRFAGWRSAHPEVRLPIPPRLWNGNRRGWVVPLINLDRVATDVNAWRSSAQQLVTNRYWCYLNRADSARKNSAGVAMRSDVR
jgi:hypothetical protein